jgi:proline racemase
MPFTPRESTPLEIVQCHAGGEVGDVIVGGFPAPPGKTLWEQSRHIATDGTLRAFVLNEPRGGVFKHMNLLVPPTDPAADLAFIIMEPEDTPPMSGSNAMCVTTVALETGIHPMQEPITKLTLQAPAGLVPVTAQCSDGKVTAVTLTNVPSFVVQRQVPLDVPGVGTITVDTAFGGDSFVIATAKDLGLRLEPEHAHTIADVGMALREAANTQLTFTHPLLPEWQHHSFAFITGDVERTSTGLTSRNACVINPGKLDRSPTGTGCSAFMAVLHDRGDLSDTEDYVGRSVIDSAFTGRIASRTQVGSFPAIVPTITGQAWIYGRATIFAEATDPWPLGYRLSDTWGRLP